MRGVRGDGDEDRRGSRQPRAGIDCVGAGERGDESAAGHFLRQRVDETESRDEPRDDHAGHAGADDREAGVHAVRRERIGRQPFPSRGGNGAEEDGDPEQPEQAIHHDAERGGCLAAHGRFLEEVVALDDVAAGAAGNEEAEEKTDEHEPVQPPPRDVDALHAQEDLPADSGEDFKHAVRADTRGEPAPVGLLEFIQQRLALVRIVKDPPQQRGAQAELEQGEECFFHR